MKKKNNLCEKQSEDDKRLLISFFFSFVLFSFVINYFLFNQSLLASIFVFKQQKKLESDKLYHVLLEQDFQDPVVKDEYKALSNRDSAGSSQLTKKKGFHTLSPFQKLVLGDLLGREPLVQSKSSQKTFLVEFFKNKTVKKIIPKKKKKRNLKIPSNYRFKNDFLFHWNGNYHISIPTKNIEHYDYFKNMVQQIRDAFAAPGGGNYIYRDNVGFVINQGILPGETKVQFLLDKQGNVLDLKVVFNTQGQPIVTQACIDAIQGQNFGPVPKSLQKTDLIFGINFIFPNLSF